MNPSFLQQKRGRAHSAAFTLIELLVVISIIAILAGLAFPAVSNALGQGKKTQARNDVQQIVAAIKAYQAEYNRLPSETSSNDNSAEQNLSEEEFGRLMQALVGKDTTLNPRGIVFIEPKVTRNKKGGMDSQSYIYYDPWGNAYVVKLDTSYDSKINYYNPGGASEPNVYGSAVAVSPGPNGKIEDPYSTSSDDITSFK